MSSGRETILPVVTMLLFGDGGERSDEVLKKRSSPSLDLFIWQGSDGLGGIMFMVFGLAWVVPDLAHLSFFHWLDCSTFGLAVLVCDVNRRIGFLVPPLLVFCSRLSARHGE